MEITKVIYEPFMLEIGINTPEKLTLLLKFCSDNGIYVPPLLNNPFKPICLDTEKKIPTVIYKEFCGSENLTNAGTTSVADVSNFIRHYAEVQRLINPDGSIELPKNMQEAFNTEKSRFYPHEIASLATRAFPS